MNLKRLRLVDLFWGWVEVYVEVLQVFWERTEFFRAVSGRTKFRSSLVAPFSTTISPSV